MHAGVHSALGPYGATKLFDAHRFTRPNVAVQGREDAPERTGITVVVKLDPALPQTWLQHGRAPAHQGWRLSLFRA
jgi:hypothetical protein